MKRVFICMYRQHLPQPDGAGLMNHLSNEKELAVRRRARGLAADGSPSPKMRLPRLQELGIDMSSTVPGRSMRTILKTRTRFSV